MAVRKHSVMPLSQTKCEWNRERKRDDWSIKKTKTGKGVKEKQSEEREIVFSNKLVQGYERKHRLGIDLRLVMLLCIIMKIKVI